MFYISHQQAGLNLAAIAAGALTAALIAQYVYGLAPCVLCIYQRIPYAVIVVLGLMAGFGPKRFVRFSLYLISAALAVELALAVFHVGVEQKWWEGTSACKINLEGADAAAILEQIRTAPRALCTDIAWSLFGISMAGYNALLSLGLFASIALYLKRKK